MEEVFQWIRLVLKNHWYVVIHGSLAYLNYTFEDHDWPSLNDQTRTISRSLVDAIVKAWPGKHEHVGFSLYEQKQNYDKSLCTKTELGKFGVCM